MIKFKSVLKDELSDFLLVRQASKSKSAFDHDSHTLRLFDEYLVSINCKSKELSEKQVTSWISTLNGKSSTIANAVIVVRLFFETLKSYNIKVYIPPIPKVKDDYIPYIFTEEEIQKMFNIADSLQKGKPVKNIYIHLEFPMILRIMYGCGLRIGETLSLKVKDIDLDTGVLILKNSKDDKQRIVPMHQSLTNILGSYCAAMGVIGIPEANLFPTLDLSESISVQSAQSKFNYILSCADISLLGRKKHQRGPCLHCLRHAFVFNSFKKAEMDGRGVDDSVPYLSLYLGHDSLKETEKYLKFSSELFPESMALFDAYTTTIFPEVDYDSK